MMLDLWKYDYSGLQVRVYRDASGAPWWVAKDVCEVLGFGNPRQALSTHLDEDEKGVQNLDTPGGVQQFATINESGLYTLILRSNKPQAKAFRKWVTSEVLPSIRKTGSYSVTGNQQIPQSLPDALRLAADLAEEKLQLENRIEADRPKVEFAEAITDSTQAFKIGDFAKVLCKNGLNIGQNRLFSWLRENKYLMHNNVPYQAHVDNGNFVVIEKMRQSENGPVPYIQTRITGKGQVSITRKLREARDEQEGASS